MGKGSGHMNDICKSCGHIRNCLNGMYCTLAGIYVEYQNVPICETDGLFDGDRILQTYNRCKEMVYFVEMRGKHSENEKQKHYGKRQ